MFTSRTANQPSSFVKIKNSLPDLPRSLHHPPLLRWAMCTNVYTHTHTLEPPQLKNKDRENPRALRAKPGQHALLELQAATWFWVLNPKNGGVKGIHQPQTQKLVKIMLFWGAEECICSSHQGGNSQQGSLACAEGFCADWYPSIQRETNPKSIIWLSLWFGKKFTSPYFPPV